MVRVPVSVLIVCCSQCELLEHLDLSDCPNVGDDGLLALSRLPRLKTCSLYRVEDITDAGILVRLR